MFTLISIVWGSFLQSIIWTTTKRCLTILGQALQDLKALHDLVWSPDSLVIPLFLSEKPVFSWLRVFGLHWWILESPLVIWSAFTSWSYIFCNLMQLSYRDLSKYLKILEYKTLSTMSQYANTTIEIIHIESGHIILRKTMV